MLKLRTLMGYALLVMAGSVFAAEADSAATAAASKDMSREEAVKALINYQALREDKDVRASALDAYSPAPFISDTLLGAGALVQSGPIVSKHAQEKTDRTLKNSVLKRDFPMEIVNDDEHPLHAPSMRWLPYLTARHVISYCNDAESGVVGCGNLDKKNRSASDLNINNLLAKKRIESDTVDAMMASDTIRMLSAAYYPAYVADGEAITNLSQTNAMLLTRRYISTAQSSIALASFDHMLANRMPVSDKEPRSRLEIMEDEASRRFNDRAWVASLATTPESGVLRELAHMEAFRLYLEFQRFQQTERVEALLAGLLANNVEQLRAGDERHGIALNARPLNPVAQGAPANANIGRPQ